MSPPAPHLPFGHLQYHLRKIPSALWGLTAWKGHIWNNSITKNSQLSFTKNESHYIQPVSDCPF